MAKEQKDFTGGTIVPNKNKRAAYTNQIKATINATLEKGKTINYKNFIIAVMSNLNLSRASAKDLVDVSLFRLGIKNNEDLSDEKFVSLWKNTSEKTIDEQFDKLLSP